jgi:ubiquinone/menaquinone biosynthesis C-methylase UbiE
MRDSCPLFISPRINQPAGRLRNKSMNKKYVHGYKLRENLRLQDQASTLVELLHSDTFYPAGSQVLEAGCGVGAQTTTLARNSPDAHITSFDISEKSVAEARKRIEEAGFTNVSFQQGDIFNLNFEPESFDHIFVCFVLEHLAQPLEALNSLKDLLKVGGSITVIEGDHGSTCFYPDNEASRRAIQCQVELQRRSGGNANIGRELYPLLNAAGFRSLSVSPRMVYVDSSKPHFVEGFIKNTFVAMIEGIRESAISAGLIDENTFDEGIAGLYRTTETDGVFCYTFFKAVAIKE